MRVVWFDLIFYASIIFKKEVASVIIFKGPVHQIREATKAERKEESEESLSKVTSNTC